MPPFRKFRRCWYRNIIYIEYTVIEWWWTGLGFICIGIYFFFLQLLITIFVSNVHESAHDEVNGDIFLCIFLHILDKMHIFAYFKKINIIAYFNYKNAKNAYFMVYFVKSYFITVQKYLKVIKSISYFCYKLVRWIFTRWMFEKLSQNEKPIAEKIDKKLKMC